LEKSATSRLKISTTSAFFGMTPAGFAPELLDVFSFLDALVGGLRSGRGDGGVQFVGWQ
jgi:hypothetical protein